METEKGFKIQQCSAFRVVTKEFNHSSILTLFIKFPIQSLFLFTVICFTLLMAPMVWAGGVIQLPQTGQTTCWDRDGSVIACPGTGQDGDIKAGVGWPNPRFAAGTGAEADCMIDNLTGLMWPKNGNLPNGTKTWNDAIDYPKTLTLCGHSDWRLPNINELESLLNASQSDPGTWLNTQGFTNVQSSYYWSSSTSAYNTGYAWYVYMGYGIVAYNDKSSSFYVWPVRSGQGGSVGSSVIWRTGQTTSYRSGDDGDLKQGISWPSPRFTDHANGKVTDNLTGIIWTKDASAPGPSACSPGTTKAWQGALDYVKCLNSENYLGHNDWRLPNRKELYSLGDYSKYNPVIPSGHLFTNVQSNYYWSSSTDATHTGHAWDVYMYSGYVFSSDKSNYNYVWPVRSGQVGNSVNLVISKSGTGSGIVTSSPTGISCGSTCSAVYSSGTFVVLDASPASGSTFTGWSGDCSGNLTICTVTMDTSKNVTAVFTTEPIEINTLNLNQGWNFVSFPKVPANTAIDAVLEDIYSKVNIVWGWDSQNQLWKRWKPGGASNTLSTMEASKGYWAYINPSGSINMTGWTSPPSTTVLLYAGWNLIGYLGMNSADASTALNTISGKWDVVWGWDNGEWSAKYATISTVPPPIQPLSNFNQRKAYWIKTTQAVEWSQSGGDGTTAPAGVTASAGDGQVSISWSAVSGATSYNIHWSATSGVNKSTGTKISNVTSPYTHTGLTNGSVYYYVVTSINSAGESAESVQVSAQPQRAVVASETWNGSYADGVGSAQFTFVKTSDGAITAEGEWTYGSTVCPFMSAPVTISGTSFYFTASGTARTGSATSGFTTTVNGTASGGHASGTYSVTFNTPGWSQQGSPTWTADRTSGSGITN